ncbi:hypothetical protein KEJ50_01960 [Candidatus Bathyarchaeota archaeon]|nr:hypothetical protein [Candidatus Bathyarchaeota archaeon]
MQSLTKFILKLKNVFHFEKEEPPLKDKLISELEAVKQEIEEIKNKYEEKIAFLESEISKIKNAQELKNKNINERLKENGREEALELSSDIEALRREVLQVLEELEKE